MYSVVIVAAGSGSRTGLGYNKIFFEVRKQPLIKYTVDKFLNDDDFTEVIIVLSKKDEVAISKIFNNSKIKYVHGGNTRQESVLNGLYSVSNEFVFIHDCARPNVSKEDIDKLKKTIQTNDACILYIPVKDSVMIMEDDQIKGYVNRDTIGFVQTPQVFKTNLIKQAHIQGGVKGNVYTDDASLFIGELNKSVHLIEGNETNLKVTTFNDLKIMEDLLW